MAGEGDSAKSVHFTTLKQITSKFATANFTKQIVAFDDNSGHVDVLTHAPPVGDDIPWILKYVEDNRGEALLCILFSVAVGICFILLAVLCCLCWRWKKAKKEGNFTVAKSNGEGGARMSSYVQGANKETEGLLSPGVAPNSSGGRTYSSPRLIRAEYARGANVSTGANTPSSVSNANVVGLYLSQAPKSRWSRASDATVWPLPPSSLHDGDTSLVSTVARTLPMQEKPLFIPSPGNPGRTVIATSSLSPPMPTMFSQNNQTLPSQVHSSFAPASPTDYLFNRQSVINDPRMANVPGASRRIASRDSPRTVSPASRDALLRKPLNDDGAMPRSALSYQGQGRVGPLGPSPQHHSYLGPNHPTSPPILPAPASSPWPARTSQIMLDQQEMDSTSAGTNNNN